VGLLIIVEGLDNTGKTTLVEELLKDIPTLKHRPSIGNTHDPKQIADQAYHEAFLAPPGLISDRSRIISEYVYTPVLRARSLAYDFEIWWSYIQRLVTRHHLIIFCRRDPLEILETFDERDQLPGVQEHLITLHHRYEAFMGMLDFLTAVQEDRDACVRRWNLKMGFSEPRRWVRDYLKGVDS